MFSLYRERLIQNLCAQPTLPSTPKTTSCKPLVAPYTENTKQKHEIRFLVLICPNGNYSSNKKAKEACDLVCSRKTKDFQTFKDNLPTVEWLNR